MKNTKILHRLSMLIAILIIIPLTILSITASIKKTDTESPENNQNVEVQNPDSENKEDDTNIHSEIVEGIYYFQKDAEFSDICYTKEKDDVYKYFKTKDRNGVIKAILNLGFTEFLNNLTKHNNQDKFIEFSSNNKVSSYTMENEFYVLLNETEFEYTYEDSKYSSTGINPIIETDGTGKVVTLSYPFYYETDEGNIEITPISVKVVLTYKTRNYESVIENNDFKYEYKSNSSTLLYDFDKNIDLDNTLDKLKVLFNLKDSNNILFDIETLLSSYQYTFNSNFSTITLEDFSNGLKFASYNINNLSFTAFNNANIKISNKSFGVSSVKSQLELTIEVDSMVTMQFIIEILN